MHLGVWRVHGSIVSLGFSRFDFVSLRQSNAALCVVRSSGVCAHTTWCLVGAVVGTGRIAHWLLLRRLQGGLQE